MEDLPGFNSQRQRTALRLRLPEKLPGRTEEGACSLGDLGTVEAMAEIIHRWAVRGPQHLVSRSYATGSGLQKVADRKECA